jgi:hypothetical protein
LVGIPFWEEMRKVAILRGIELGALVDYGSQSTVGSVRNLVHFPGVRIVRVVFQFVLTYLVNTIKVEKELLTNFRVSWLNGDGNDALSVGFEEIVDHGVRAGNNHGGNDEEAWWVESRGNWESFQAPEVTHCVQTMLEPISQSRIQRFGRDAIISHKSDKMEMDRFISTVRTDTEIVEYTFYGTAGRVTLPIRKTCNRIPERWTAWHLALDKSVKGEIQRARLWAYSHYNRNISVRYSTEAGVGNMPTFYDFGGFGNL